MDNKIVKHGSHIINNDVNGYMYNHNISQGYDFSSHIHKCYEFILVFHGNLLYNVEGNDYMLSDGDFVMTTPSELHSFSFPGNCTYDRAFLHIYPGMLDKFPELADSLNLRKPGFFNRIPSELVKKHGIDVIFSSIEKYCADPVPETDFMVFTYMLQLITVIGRILREENPPEQTIIANKKAGSILSYIDRHYTESITLEDISGAVYMSPSYTSRMFKKETGMTIKEYINMRRVTKAKNLLMESRKASSIFTYCGFSDYSTFYRAFTKYIGMTPDELKHMHD
ncbi:MAG: helix-turn-helix domain-containing protein [Candidatus Ornithomonoglobus sp.]